MCSAGAGIGAVKGLAQVQAQNSAYENLSERYTENAVNVNRALGFEYANLGISFSQSQLARSQRKLEIDSAKNKAIAKARNSSLKAGLGASHAAAILENSYFAEASEAVGRVDQEMESAATAFGIQGQAMEIKGQQRIDALDPGDPPNAVAQGLTVLGSIWSGHQASMTMKANLEQLNLARTKAGLESISNWDYLWGNY